LRQAIFDCLAESGDSEAGVVALTALRCRDSLRLAADSLQEARRHAACAAGEEIVAAEIRVALDELAQVVGAVYTEDILDRIFSRFCIGK
jgi:tRNA modification GTPase